MDDSRINNIIWETIGLPEYMDPHKNFEAAGEWIHSNIYETLVTYDFDSSDTTPSVPLLAESYQISDDGLNYTFYLRQGVTFHDDSSFNASAAQMNIWRILGRGWDDGWGPAYMVAEPILGGAAVEVAMDTYGDGYPEHVAAWTDWQLNSEAIIVLDEFTVRIRLEFAYAPFLAILARPVCSMISPTFFMAHGGMAPGGDNSHMEENACGTGPYKLVDWIQDDRIELTLNDNYWRANIAKTTHAYAGSIANVTIKLNTDEDSRILNLQEGKTDGCAWPASHTDEIWNGVNIIGDGTLQSNNSNLKLWAGYPTYSLGFLGLNARQYINLSSGVVLNPWYNINARRAVSSSYNIQLYIDESLYGWAEQMTGSVPRGMFAHADDIPSFSYNISKAVDYWNLAMAAGLDDIWANNSYEYNIYCSSIYRESILELVKNGIEQILEHQDAIQLSSELTINTVVLDWQSYLSMRRNNSLPVNFLGLAPDFADPHPYVNSIVTSSSMFPVRVGLNNSIGESGVPWDSDMIDGLIEAAKGESDPSIRLSLYRSIQEAIGEHCVYFGGYQPQSFHVERHEMNGYVYNPMRQPYFFHYCKFPTHRGFVLNIPFEVLIASAAVICVLTIIVIYFNKSSRS